MPPHADVADCCHAGSQRPFDTLVNGSNTSLIGWNGTRRGDKVFERFTGKKQDTLWYYREVVATLKANGPERLARELERVVTEIERLSAT